MKILNNNPLLFFIIPIALFFASCFSEKKNIRILEAGITNIEKKYIKDKSLSVYEIYPKNNDGILSIEGETDNLIAYSKILQLTDSLSKTESIINNVLMLPDTLLRDSNFAVVNVSVTPIREKPKHSSQMVDQAIMGNIITLLREESGWYLSKTHYDYIGWIHKTGLFICDSIGKNIWINNAHYIINDLNTLIYSLPNNTSQPIADAVLNNILIGEKQDENWMSVILPDGRSGYITKNNMTLNINYSKIVKKKETILYKAYRMTGTPYLWGGNSTKGNDCSGFTQTVYKANGIQLPRDARQQALEGILIYPNKTWSNIFPGDLLFFGKNDKVSHVGISTGGKKFVHQGGMVKINSLDEKDENFSADRLKTFLFIKRILDS